MGSKHTFRDLIVWQKAVELSKAVYRMTQAMPPTERFGLTSQIRRAVVSVPSNIAEGNARQTLRDYLQFLVIACGSLAELETQIIIAQELEMLKSPEPVPAQLQEVCRMLQALIESLRRKEDCNRNG